MNKPFSNGSTVCGRLLMAASNTCTANTNSDPKTILAQIDGTTITLGEFEQKRAENLFQAKNNHYQAERKALDEFIDDYLCSEKRSGKI